MMMTRKTKNNETKQENKTTKYENETTKKKNNKKENLKLFIKIGEILELTFWHLYHDNF